MPGRSLPVLAAAGVLALALPVFLLAGWPVEGWALAVVVWLAAQALGLVLTRLASRRR